MIRGMQIMLYASGAEELRTYIKDKFGLPVSDVGGGWLILDGHNLASWPL